MGVQHCVTLFPAIVEQWVHDFRAQHDPLAGAIAPHLTLVFPTEKLSGDELREEVTQRAGHAGPMRAVLRSAMVMPDAFTSHRQAHVFLVPDEGFGSVMRLHQRLYSGRLQDELRDGIPFVPHLTIGAALSIPQAKALVAELNDKAFAVEVRADCVTIVRCVEPKRERIHEIPL